MEGERMGAAAPGSAASGSAAGGAAAGGAEDGMARLRADLDELRAQFRRLGGDAAQAARDAVQERIEAVQAEVEALAGRARRKGRSTTDSLEGFARRNPLGALAAAFGIGILTARLFARPRR